MPKPGYLNLRTDDDTGRHLETICKRLGLDPEARGSAAKAAKFAIRTVALQAEQIQTYHGRTVDEILAMDSSPKKKFLLMSVIAATLGEQSGACEEAQKMSSSQIVATFFGGR